MAEQSRIKIPNLWGGVSRQAPHLRFSNQLQESVNIIPSIVSGAMKRAGTKLIAEIAGLSASGDYKLHEIVRDQQERYLVLYGAGVLRVFEIHGDQLIEATVTDEGNALAYLNLNTPSADQIKLITIADYTLAVNTTVPVSIGPSESYSVSEDWPDYETMTSATPAPNSIHRTKKSTIHPAGYFRYVPDAEGSRTYSRWKFKACSEAWSKIDRYKSADYNPMGFTVYMFKTDEIASFQGFTVVVNFENEVINSMHDVAAKFQRALQNAGAGEALVAWENVTAKTGRFVITGPVLGMTSFQPPSVTMPPGTGIYNLTDSSGKPFYYTEGELDPAVTTPPIPWEPKTVPVDQRWKRIAPPNQGKAIIDADTMPVQLVRMSYTGDGVTPAVFKLQPVDWTPRLSGSDEDNPPPNLWRKGAKIADIALHRNRLCLAGDEYLCFSQAGDFFNFWIEDPQNIVDSDPIDIPLSSEQITLIDFIVPFRKAMVIFTKAGRQFELNAPEALTASTAAITPSTSYQALPIRPSSVGNTIYFPGKVSYGTALYEYFYDDSRAVNQAADTSAHVAGYLPLSIRSVRSSGNDNAVYLLPPDSGSLLVYRFWWNGNKKEQSAWGKLNITTGRICDIGAVESHLYMLIERDSTFVIERMDMIQPLTDPGMPWPVHLDGCTMLTGSFDGTHTTWTLPVADAGVDTVVTGPGFDTPGQTVSVARSDAVTVRSVGDYSAAPVYVGRSFTMQAQLSPIYHRDREGIADLKMQVVLRKVVSHHADSGIYQLRATAPRRADRTKALQTSDLTTGIMAGWFNGDAANIHIFIESKSPMPCNITGMEIDADVIERSR